MTIVISLLLGAGAILIISAIEDKPIVDTFQRIIRGEYRTQQQNTTGVSLARR